MNERSFFYFQRIAIGVTLSIVGFIIFSLWKADNFPKHLLLYEGLPTYEFIIPDSHLLKPTKNNKSADSLKPTSDLPVEGNKFAINKHPMIEPQTKKTEVISTLSVIFEPDTTELQEYEDNPVATREDIELLKDASYLQKYLYNFDSKTRYNEADFNINGLLSVDLSLSNAPGPKILIYHTHGYENYANSANEADGVMMVGNELKEILENDYQIPTIHLTERFDLVDGSVSVKGAYQRSETYMEAFLQNNPSIEVVIDLHRDGVGDHLRLVSQVNNKETAQIMFVNGISKILKDGQLEAVPNLPNPHLQTNLAFSLALQLEGNELYPGLMRKGYINAYRYALHLQPKSLLVEVGAQTNTTEEAMAAARPLAEILSRVLK